MSAAARKAGRGLCGALFDEVLDKCLKGWNVSRIEA